MARQHLAQHGDAAIEQTPSGIDIPHRPFQVGDVLPAVCTVGHVAWVFGISESAVHQLRQRGRLREFLLPSLGDRKARYSGRRLQQWAAGEFQPDRTFGRSRLRHVSQPTEAERPTPLNSVQHGR